MLSLYKVHVMKAERAGQSCLTVRLPVRMIQLENRWTDLDEIWYELYTTGVQSKMEL
jgi:hypothetical protein